MASLRHRFEVPVGIGSLLLSLGLHLALVAGVLVAGWHKPPVPPSVMEVRLVAPLPEGNPAASGKPAANGSGSLAHLAKPPLPPQAEGKLPKKSAPPVRKKLATPTVPPPSDPKPQVADVIPQFKPVPASTTPVRAPQSFPSASSGSGDRQASYPGGSGKVDTRGASGLGSGNGSGGQGPPGGGSGSLAAVQNRYLGLIRTRILAHRHYPPIARARQMEGEVRLRFTLSNTGSLSREVQVVKPSGFSVLDEQAVQCVRAAAPFPPFPPELRKDSLTVEVPIVYRLKDRSG